jgi:peptide/nickel transport system substrate-binding protein
VPSRRAVCLGGALAVALRPSAAGAQKAADILRVTWRDAVVNIDPYANQLRTGLVIAHHVWDCLVDRDPETLQLRPLLARRWSQPDDTSIDFELRDDVQFHDGSPLGPEDVAYTVRTVLASSGVAVPGLFAWLAGAEVLDAHRVRLKLHRLFPMALEYLATALPILPQRYRERVGADGFAQAPVGSGPYRVAARDGPERLVLERFDGYRADSPKPRPIIRRIAIRAVDDEQAPFTDLLTEAADWIWQIGPDQFDAISHQTGLQAMRVESMRLGYLSLDAAGRSGADGPLTHLAVRQAVLHALDRPAIAQRLGSVATRVPEAPCYPTQFGCDAAAAVRYPYDPARAKALLAEAGYAAGFETDLVSYVLPQDGQAVRSYLQAVGITANLVQLPTEDALARAAAGQAPLFLGNWGSYSINDVAAFLPQFFAGGPLDYARLPELEALLTSAGSSGDADQRRALYRQAIRTITAQALWTPTHTYATTYGFSRALNFRAFPDELPRFYAASWK